MKLNISKNIRDNGTFELKPADWRDAAMLQHIAAADRNFAPNRFSWVPENEYSHIRFMTEAHGWELVETVTNY